MSEGSDLETIAEALAFEWPLSYDDSPFTTSYIEILLNPLIQFNAQLFNLFRRWYALLFNSLCLSIHLNRKNGLRFILLRDGASSCQFSNAGDTFDTHLQLGILHYA